MAASGARRLDPSFYPVAASHVAQLVGACAGTDPEMWFDWHRRSACVEVCAGCPVRTSCLAGALGRDEQRGVWGGLALSRRWVCRAGPTAERSVRGEGAEPLRGVRHVLRAEPGQGGAEIAVAVVRRPPADVRDASGSSDRSAGPGAGWVVGGSVDGSGGSEQAVASMRTLLPASLRDRPVERWPWELRLLFEFPDDVPWSGGSIQRQLSDEHGRGRRPRRGSVARRSAD